MAKVRVNFDKAGVMSSFDGGLERGLTAAAILVEADGKLRVPVDTGRLRQSITHRVEDSTATVGTGVEYAASVEYGYGQRAQPYLRPALDQNREKIRRLISAAIGGALK